MGFKVYLYSFSKKLNSTKQPPLAHEPNLYFADVLLKDNSDVLNPILLIKSNMIDLGTGKFFTPNYAYIEEFKRYYYIANMVWNKGVWEMQCKVDVLASFKDQIGAQSLFITRSSQLSDGSIIDTTYPAKGVPTVINQIETAPWDLDQDNGYCYVVGIAGQSVAYYAMTFSQLQIFLDAVLSDTYVDGLYGSNAWQTSYPEIKALTNPLQYITSIKWYPFEITSGTPITALRLGWVDIGGFTQAKKITNFLASKSKTVTKSSNHPQASTRGAYLNNAPYSKYTLIYPGFGQIELDASIVAQSTSIFTTVITDVRTGEGTLYVEDDSLYELNRVSGQIGVEYQVGQTLKQGYGLAKITQSGLSTLGNVLSLDFAGAVGSSVGAIGDYARSQVPSIKTIGSDGGVNNLFGAIALQYEFKTLINEDNTRKGRPLCQVKTINTLTGFIQVDRADIDIETADGEQEQIRSFLERGFYYE